MKKIHSLAQRAQKTLRRNSRSRAALAGGGLVVVVLAGWGVASLSPHADTTTSASFDAENGTKSGVTTLADASAAGGSAIQFGSVTTSTPTTAGSVSQYGITWTFDKAYPVGRFANGDWWVQGPVTITALSPEFTGTQNGWEVNPNSASQQGLDNRLDGFQASRVPNLPYVATAGKSIIKAISKSGTCGNDGQYHYPCLTTAAVLTVLGGVPANNGTNTFRPPFFGTDKPMFTTTQLRTDVLPSRSPVGGAPSLADTARRYQRVQVDYGNAWSYRYMHASENYIWRDGAPNEEVSEYGAEIGIDSANAALRLMLNDSLSAKMPALVNYVQYGIDAYGMHKGGVTWQSDGGHMTGRKLPAVFAAVLLDDAAMKLEISNAAYGTYGDDGHFYYSTNTKTIAAMSPRPPALFGKVCSAGMYELNQTNDTGSRDCRDPLGMIDGGQAPGDSYQNCCVSQPVKGNSLAARLLPGGKAVWNYNATHDYVDRWVSFGAWATPDDWNSQGRTPARNYTSLHGMNKDAGYYGSTFVNNMWTAYRNTAE